jgi:hypothetical protein
MAILLMETPIQPPRLQLAIRILSLRTPVNMKPISQFQAEKEAPNLLMITGHPDLFILEPQRPPDLMRIFRLMEATLLAVPLLALLPDSVIRRPQMDPSNLRLRLVSGMDL